MSTRFDLLLLLGLSTFHSQPALVVGSRLCHHGNCKLRDSSTNTIRRHAKERNTKVNSKWNVSDNKKDKLLDKYPLRPLARVDVGYENKTSAMNLRFNKFKILSPPPSQVLLPLGDNHYSPMSLHQTGNFLRNHSTAISIFHPDDCKECSFSPDFAPDELLGSTRLVLTHPSHDPNSPYWNELWEVILIQLDRQQNGNIDDWLTLPIIWHDYTLQTVATAVHDEYPGVHHVAILKYMLGGALDRSGDPNCAECANIDRRIIPHMSHSEFIRGAVMLADLNTWAIGAIGPICFSVKWNYGRARPEEVVWAIYAGEIGIKDGVPEYIIQTVQNQFNLTTPSGFTAYPEGCPNHPSFPAMHGASSTASLWMAIVMNLTVEQLCHVKALDYAIAYARTIAGVHYPSDNIAGLNIGQEILSKLLPRYLNEKYGSDVALVEEKIANYRFDWMEYLTGECFPDNHADV